MKVALLAYPRSGSTLLRILIAYILKTIPKQPHGHVDRLKELIDWHTKDDVDFRKFHFQREMGNFGASHIILLVRDPIENIISYIMYSGQAEISNINISKFKSKISQYQTNINFFNGIKKKTKLLVVYENLLKNFNKEMEKLAALFNRKLDQNDLNKLHELKEACWKLKTKLIGEECPSERQSDRVYFKQLSSQQQDKIRQAAMPTYNKLSTYGVCPP